jgi:hypothetical protein
LSRQKQQPGAEKSALTPMEWAKEHAPIKQIVLCISDDSDNSIETVQYNDTDWPDERGLPFEWIIEAENDDLKSEQTLVAVRLLTEEMAAIFAHPYLNDVALKDVLQNMREFAPLPKTPVFVVVWPKESVN